MTLPGTFTQRSWPGAGDVDDCWVVATIWSAVAREPSAWRPTVTQFRELAGDPDDGDRDGGSLAEVIRGARAAWPRLPIDRFESADVDELADRVAHGAVASIAVWCGALPAELQYGFRFAHQGGLAWDGRDLVFMNPLARSGEPPRRILVADLRRAMLDPRLGYSGRARAAIFEVVPMAIFIQENRPGRFRIPAGRRVTGYSLSGDRIVPAKVWQDNPESGARFIAVLQRTTGVSPTPLLKVTEGFFAGLYVPTGQVDEKFDPLPTPGCEDEIAAAVTADRLDARIVWG